MTMTRMRQSVDACLHMLFLMDECMFMYQTQMFGTCCRYTVEVMVMLFGKQQLLGFSS